MAEPHEEPAALHPHLVDVAQRDQGAAMDPHESGFGPAVLQCRKRNPDQMAAGGRVQPRVVTLCLHEQDLRALHEPGDTSQLHGDGLVGRSIDGEAWPACLHHPADRFGQAIGTHRFEYIVDGTKIESVHGMLFIGGDEDDVGPMAEASQDPGEVEAIQTGHRDVAEEDVNRLPLQCFQGFGAAACGLHLADPRILFEQPGKLAERWGLVVNDQRSQRLWRRRHVSRVGGYGRAVNAIASSHLAPTFCPSPWHTVAHMTSEIAEARQQVPIGKPLSRPFLALRVRPELRQQLIRFAVVGVASTLAYGLLFLALRLVLGAFAANALALLLTAVANTAANRRLTFGVRGASGLTGDHVVGLLAFGAGLALTTGSLALLHATSSPGRGAELLVLTVANALATLLRFVALKLRIGS